MVQNLAEEDSEREVIYETKPSKKIALVLALSIGVVGVGYAVWSAPNRAVTAEARVDSKEEALQKDVFQSQESFNTAMDAMTPKLERALAAWQDAQEWYTDEWNEKTEQYDVLVKRYEEMNDTALAKGLTPFYEVQEQRRRDGIMKDIPTMIAYTQSARESCENTIRIFEQMEKEDPSINKDSNEKEIAEYQAMVAKYQALEQRLQERSDTKISEATTQNAAIKSVTNPSEAALAEVRDDFYSVMFE